MLRAIVYLSVLLAGVARADTRGILLESHAAERPDYAARFVDAMVASMGEDAPLHGPALARRVESQLSATPGPPEPGEDPKALVQRGRSQFIEGKFAEAITTLERARSAMLERPALLATNQPLRDALNMALLYLGHACLRTDRGEEATERVGEVVRSFPDKELSLARYGPELVKLYRRVRREMNQQPRGTLSVKTTPPGCLLFVNERYVGLSPITVEGLHQGRYRVYAQLGQARGRVHRVNVTGQGAQLSINFELDHVLVTEPLVGFRYDTVEQMEKREVADGAAVARALDAPTVFLIGFRRHEGHRALLGTVINAATGRVVRSGMITLEPAEPSQATLGAMGSFLLAGKGGSGVIVRSGGGLMTHGAAHPARQDDDGPGFFSARVWKWITLGLGVAGVGAGATLIALDGKGTCGDTRCPDAYNTMTPGIATIAVGGAAAVASVVLFILDAREDADAERRALIAPGLLPGGGGGLSATFQF